MKSVRTRIKLTKTMIKRLVFIFLHTAAVAWDVTDSGGRPTFPAAYCANLIKSLAECVVMSLLIR